MKRKLATAFLAAALTFQSPVAYAQQDSAHPAKSLPIGTCINLGNTLEPETEGAWGGAAAEQADFERIAAAGFKTVRIPVRWSNKTSDQPPYTVDPAWMDRIQQIVDWALAAKLNVILNSHHFDGIHDDPLGISDRHGAVWSQIAQRFADYPEDHLWFELENEPHENFDHSNLLETLAPALKAVRAVNPTRAVIIGGEDWSGLESLATLPLPEDPNVYPTFHYYDPFAYTHQGASWVAPDIPPPGRNFPTDEDKAQLAKDVAKIEAYVERTGKVPFMGEVGAYDKHISTKDRAQYHRVVREAFEPTGIGICVWAYANTFPFYDRKAGAWKPGMLKALGLEE
ncbi:glycoside hydrolase family 5 protein [Altererythrobacter sp.]|uniref:glycoside hydrolase family 5 protein n=1 Tax=Altererythrobacter sp. TaxID=1872480 RepID=UPI003D1357C1